MTDTDKILSKKQILIGIRNQVMTKVVDLELAIAVGNTKDVAKMTTDVREAHSKKLNATEDQHKEFEKWIAIIDSKIAENDVSEN